MGQLVGRLIMLLAAAALAGGGSAGAAPTWRVEVSEAVWHDAARQRDIPIRFYRPVGRNDAPLVIFSHGLGGNRAAGERWLEHWAAHGIAGLAVQHAGSDEALLRAGSLRRSLQSAMSREQLLARTADIRFVLDEIAHRAARHEAPWPALDRERIGLAGHSFGAVTTQALAGERLSGDRLAHGEPRLKAFIAFSPSARGPEGTYAERFATIRAPFFSITGTRDDGIGVADISAENRTRPYAAMPPPDKYLLVFAGGKHLHFSGARQRRNEAPKAMTDRVLAASLAFWQTYLEQDAAAGRWLRQEFSRSLGEGDRFEWK